MEGYSSVSIVVCIAGGAREKEREREREGEFGPRRSGRGWATEGDRGREKEKKYGGGGCYGYTAAITIRVLSYSKLQSSPRSVSACVS